MGEAKKDEKVLSKANLGLNAHRFNDFFLQK